MYESGGKAWFKHIDFMILDLLCLELSFVISFLIRFHGFRTYLLGKQIDFNNPYQRNMLFLLLIHLCIYIFSEPYSGILRRGFLSECKKVFIYNMTVLVSLVMMFFITHSSIMYSRIVIFLIPSIDFVIMILYRELYKRFLRARINNSSRQDCILLITPRSHVQELIGAFNKGRINTIKPVGIVLLGESGKETSIKGIPVVGNEENIYEYARNHVVDEVLMFMESDKATEIARTFNSMGITVHICLDSLISMDKVLLNNINGIDVVTTYRNTITPGQLFVKRMIDIIAGLVGSVLTILLTIIIAPMIWIADPGPIFFRQERVGRNGRTFKMWKFRTMVKNADEMKKDLMELNEVDSDKMFKLDNDPRIIGINKKFSVGAFLRNTSLDEFPQFFNILFGQMSLIGTRPPTLDEYETYQLHHKGRLALRPGLTGMWQVYGRSNITDFEKVVKLDKFYIDHCCIALDVKILVKTFKVVFEREGAK